MAAITFRRWVASSSAKLKVVDQLLQIDGAFWILCRVNAEVPVGTD